jgi:tRNA U34 5-carboxymethylaminomethyl modifying GTPase MnmE/TrmE
LKALYDGWRADIIKCRALTEAIIDFGEDEGIEDEIYDDGNHPLIHFGLIQSLLAYGIFWRQFNHISLRQ